MASKTSINNLLHEFQDAVFNLSNVCHDYSDVIADLKEENSDIKKYFEDSDNCLWAIIGCLYEEL